nr:ribosome biogenesis GTP-binding protein YihA/YsxC [Dickeya oryzae]
MRRNLAESIPIKKCSRRSVPVLFFQSVTALTPRTKQINAAFLIRYRYNQLYKTVIQTETHTVTQQYNYHVTHFVTSAPDIRHLPADSGIEVAFAGRSNAGKSSALNTLTNQKSLARISKTPGRTQLINLFEVAEGVRLVDLPGYGYAEVPEEMKRKWQRALGEYLQKRNCLKGLVVLMDIRHPLKDLDQQMLEWAVDVGLPVLVLLTKADKLAQGAQKSQLNMVREAVLPFMGDIQVETFSSLKKTGVDKLRQKLDNWFSTLPPADESSLAESEQ